MSTAEAGLARARGAAAAGRVSPREWLRHSGTMIRRNLLSIKADPEELVDVTIFPLIMTVLFTYVFGGAMKGSVNGNYLEFLVPGILAQMLTFGTMYTGIKLSNDFSKGVIDRFRSLPIARSAVLNGHIVAAMLRLLIAAAITTGSAAVLGFRVHTSAPAFLAGLGVLMTLGLAISWVAVYIGSIAKTPQAVQGVGQLVLFPMMFASSIFAPTNTMPGWLQAFVKVNPLTTAADSARALMIGGPAFHPVWVTLAWSAALTVVFAPLAVRAYRRRS
ncbi:ABC transporter permease [Actinocrinis puniceicyclus]|uniref:Transport permease protein n=1 Tax=Actinocrinis puniceicyclus TaxID=977794 RepID=A0A8J8BD56_9ACTN|nr:ABC transporter permease [Actinocrinis puniceicyclus]MBS2962454.1 ABC transporter permease [Actinocrinis puniceicyclus]